MVQGRNTLGYLRTRTFYIPEKKVRLQIRIDHKMFDMFTSRNVKKDLISTLTSDHDHDVRPNSVDSQICRTFWEEYVRPECMIVDTLGEYCTCIINYVYMLCTMYV